MNLYSKLTIKLIFKEMFKNHIFILFSFVNMFLPLFITIISSCRTPIGAENVISIGLIVSFSTVFNQFLFMIATSFCFIQEFKTRITHKYNFNYATIYLSLFLFSLLSFSLFIICACLYSKFSLAYSNTIEIANYSINYALVSSISLFFNSLIYYEILKNWKEKKFLSYIFLGLYFSLNLILIPVFYICINWKIHSSWIGLSIGQLLTSIVVFAIVFSTYFFGNFNKQDWILDKKSLIDHFKFSLNFVVQFLLTTVLKTILIIIIAFSLELDHSATPISLMLAKIIWYNSMYFCGFLADGLIYSLEYTRLENEYKNEQEYKFILNKTFILVFGLVVMIGTLIVCIMFDFCIQPLSDLYTKNQLEPIKSPLPPNWPYNNVNGVSYIINPQEVYKYFWSPEGVYNFKLASVNNNQVTFGISYSYSIVYTTIYHVCINGSKALGIKEINGLHRKFDFKKFLSNLISTSFVIAIIIVIAIAPKDNINFIKIFPGIDSFTFATMIVSILLVLLSLLKFLPSKKSKKIKQNKNKQQALNVLS